ncbi:MAG: Ig-like domain-containing protein [Thiotrichaceae bacterium]
MKLTPRLWQSLQVAKLVLLVSNNNQPADGKSSVTLTVIARESSNSTVANVPVTLVSSSSTALFSAMSGNTDEQELFHGDSDQSRRKPCKSMFTSNVRSETASLSFRTDHRFTSRMINVTVENNGQSADGNSAIVLTVVPRDKDNQPVTGIVVAVSGVLLDAVLFDKISGNTDDEVVSASMQLRKCPGIYQVIVGKALLGIHKPIRAEITFLPHLVRANWITLTVSKRCSRSMKLLILI